MPKGSYKKSETRGHPNVHEGYLLHEHKGYILNGQSLGQVTKGHYKIKVTNMSCDQTWVRLNSFWFDSTQSQKAFIRLMTHNGFTRIDSISSRLKMDFWNLIEIDSWLKKLSECFDSNQLTTQKNPEFWFELTHDSKNFRILNRIKSWLNYSNQLLISLNFLGFQSISFTFFGISLNFVDLFWDFTKHCWPFLGIR